MLLHQIIEHKKFCLPGSIAFDFSNNSSITCVEFLNFSKNKDLEYRATSSAKYYGANYVVIVGGDENIKNDFKHNLDGIKGLSVWQDPFYIGIFVKQLLIKHNSKYNIFYGDCAGGYTALIASKNGPVNSIILTSPTINAGDLSELGIKNVQGISFRKSIENTININTGVLDAFPIIVDNINQGVRISIHWATNVFGSDLYEKNRVLTLPKNLNLNIIEHQMPPTENPHFLAKWLSDTTQLTSIIKKEMQIGNTILYTRIQ
jgi:hypothetical protein